MKDKKPTNLFGNVAGIPTQAAPLPGQRPVQISIGPKDITFKPCEQCGHGFFDTAFKQGVVSSLNPKNPTRKDMPLQVPVLLCRKCGHEFGKKVTKE